MKGLHQRLNLYTNGSDDYIFVPADPAGAPSLSVLRNSGEIVLNRTNAPIPVNAQRYPKPVYGILGIISLSLSEYIIIITGREFKDRLMGHEVYRATDFDILPINPNISASSPPHPVEGHLLALVRSHLRGGLFLLSYGWDLTRRLQAQWSSREEDVDKAAWEVADDRFFWNKFLQARLIDASTTQDLSPYILPVLYGTFDLKAAFIGGRHFQIGLISRRSRYRAGTRYFRRGIDHDGHVANFNETEQLLLVESPQSSSQPASEDFASKLSFVQIRGSIPVFWAEINTLQYKPDLQVMDLPSTPDAMRRHFEKQAAIYGDLQLVNLINQKGYEKPMKEQYERYVGQVNYPKLQYEYFDFHSECKKMRWDRISLLVDKIQGTLESQSYFQLDANAPTPLVQQQGIVRTNCMDNLDRTNVVQATLAKWTLTKQLQSLGILPASASIDDYPTLHQDFRERKVWADHGDTISRAYAGSGALKSDFTRLNKRTKKGVLEDGYKSALRYIKNNLFDGARQDAFDLMTGAWIPRRGPSSTMFLIQDDRPLLIRSMPHILGFSLFMICAGLTLPGTSSYSLLYYFLLWFLLFSISLTFIVIHGISYVSWPRLVPSTDAIYYTGPGFRSGHHGKGFAGASQISLPKTNWMASGRRRAQSHVHEIEMGTKKRVD